MSVYLYIQMYLQIKMYMIQCIKMWGVDMNKKENNIIIRIEKDKKELFQKIVGNEGLTISKVLSAFIEDTCTNGKISENIANNLK